MTDLKTSDEVIREERTYILARRKRKWPHPPSAKGNDDALIGLALSGGGIRSAATNLGVLQGLAERGILPRVDYLSTVSGGGYIGACLASLLSNRKYEDQRRDDHSAPYDFGADNDAVKPQFTTDWPRFPFRQERLAPRESREDTLPGRIQMDHIRTRASYLAPLARHFSPNVMRAVGSVFTSTFMSLLWFVLLILFVTASYMTVVAWVAPDMAMQPANRISGTLSLDVKTVDSSLSFVAAGSAVEKPEKQDSVAVLTAGARRPFTQFAGLQSPLPWTIGCGAFALGACLFSVITGRPAVLRRIDRYYYPCFFCYLILFLLILAAGKWMLLRFVAESHLTAGALLVLPPLFAGGALFGVWLAHVRSSRYATTWNITLRSQFHKLSGMLLVCLLLTLIWAILPGCMAIGMDIWKSALLLIIGAAIRYAVAGGAKAGQRKTGFIIPPKYKELLLGLCAVLFVFLTVISAGNIITDILLEDGLAANTQTWRVLNSPVLPATAGVSLALLFAFSWLVDVNKLSPHYFYRDRLAETFLQTRTPGNDLLRDDAEMMLRHLHGNGTDRKCAARGPYLLMNATLNLTAEQDLKAFNRGSDIFTFSRLFVGSQKTGYIRTEDYLVDDGQLKLARAMAISGAAVTSVMGMNTSLATSFACTVFGVRLGYWLPNFSCNQKELRDIDLALGELDKELDKTPPGDAKNRLLGKRSRLDEKRTERGTTLVSLGKSRFRSKFLRLFKELVGHTTAEGEEIYLSDGGHSGDNLGIIPLLQRRVKLLFISDSECDPDHAFDSLNSSLRNAYVDEGIRVDISLNGLRKNDKGLTPDRFAVGRIYYPEQGTEQENWLVLFKNTMTGDEIAPIINYREKSQSFPHESTGDQFFTEEQFESYRALGRFAVFDSLASEESWLAGCQLSAAKSSLLAASRAYAFLFGHVSCQKTTGAKDTDEATA